MTKKLNKIFSLILVFALSPFACAQEEYVLPKDDTKLPIKLMGTYEKENKEVENKEDIKLFV